MNVCCTDDNTAHWWFLLEASTGGASRIYPETKTYVVGLPDGRMEIHAVGQYGYIGNCPACNDPESMIVLCGRMAKLCNVCGRKWVGEQRADRFVTHWGFGESIPGHEVMSL